MNVQLSVDDKEEDYHNWLLKVDFLWNYFLFIPVHLLLLIPGYLFLLKIVLKVEVNDTPKEFCGQQVFNLYLQIKAKKFSIIKNLFKRNYLSL